jgi:hypothetical protein
MLQAVRHVTDPIDGVLHPGPCSFAIAIGSGAAPSSSAFVPSACR